MTQAITKAVMEATKAAIMVVRGTDPSQHYKTSTSSEINRCFNVKSSTFDLKYPDK